MQHAVVHEQAEGQIVVRPQRMSQGTGEEPSLATAAARMTYEVEIDIVGFAQRDRALAELVRRHVAFIGDVVDAFGVGSGLEQPAVTYSGHHSLARIQLR